MYVLWNSTVFAQVFITPCHSPFNEFIIATKERSILSVMPRPFRLRHRNAIVSNALVVALIASLNHQIHKSAILWAIVTVNIYPVDCAISMRRVFIVAVLHGPIVEQLEIVIPFCTNLDSTRTIVFILWRFRIIAPPTHIAPNYIKPRMCHSMLGIPFNALF
jgi:hypothetical protein